MSTISYTIAMEFLSTLPAWGATLLRFKRIKFKLFLSTLPAWGATSYSLPRIGWEIFLSTLPAWGATSRRFRLCAQTDISIHAPRVGSDS